MTPEKPPPFHPRELIMPLKQIVGEAYKADPELIDIASSHATAIRSCFTKYDVTETMQIIIFSLMLFSAIEEFNTAIYGSVQ